MATAFPPHCPVGGNVALARALIFKPRVLLLDEPLSALDAATRVSIRDEIRRIQQQNIAALLITHDQDEALSLADRIAHPARAAFRWRRQEHQRDRPADAFVASFIGSTNLLDGTVVGPVVGYRNRADRPRSNTPCK